MSELPPQVLSEHVDYALPPKPPILKTAPPSPAPKSAPAVAPGGYLGAKAIFWMGAAVVSVFLLAPSHVGAVQSVVGTIGLGVSVVAAALCSIGWLLKKTRDIIVGRAL